MKPILVFIIITLSPASLFCQAAEKEQKSNLAFGIELDALPYINSGYYASAWLGFENINLRIRPVVAKTDIPDFYLDDNFNRNTLNAYALIADYFFKPSFEGFWLGTGLEYWDGEIEDNFSASSNYQEFVYTLGGGYVWHFWKSFYLNPWAAFHLHLAGDREVPVGMETFKTDLLTPEASVKLGYQF